MPVGNFVSLKTVLVGKCRTASNSVKASSLRRSLLSGKPSLLYGIKYRRVEGMSAGRALWFCVAVSLASLVPARNDLMPEIRTSAHKLTEGKDEKGFLDLKMFRTLR